MKLQCVYKCRFCGLKFLEIVETSESLETILMYLSSYNFILKPHKCIDNAFGTTAQGITGIADLIGLKVVEEEDGESIHSDNKG